MIWRYARAHERSRAEKFQSTPPCVGDSKYPRSSSMVEPFQFMPLCGGRPGTYSTAFTPTKFQPTPPPPCVGRLPQPAPVRYLCLISTHAPRVWGDGHTTLQLLDTANFNPRPPCGGRPRLRIKVEGQTKNNVWEPMDLGGFVEMYGKDRTIGFSNCERYFAKGTRGITGVHKIPALTPTSPNDFLTKLFAEYNAISTREAEQNAADQEAYEAAMAEGRAIIDTITDADTANAAMPRIKAIKHALTSEKEVGVAFNAKIKVCGLFYDKVLKKYTPAPPEGEKGAQ